MIIQWEFRFPVLRIFRERCKQWDLWDSKTMGTGSKDANGMPIEFSLQLAFCWQMARAKCMCHSTSLSPFSQPRLWCALQPRRTTPPSGFRSATRTNMSGSCDSRLLNPNSQLLILTKGEILLQQKVRTVRRLRCIGYVEMILRCIQQIVALLRERS